MQTLLVASLAYLATATASSPPTAFDATNNITYQGLHQSGVEAFLGLRYGQDTSGLNRFKPPQPFVSTRGSKVIATQYGPACPQKTGPEAGPVPFALTPVTNISEDCLSLNVVRPNGTTPVSKLPVMLYIHGGSFKFGQSGEANIRPHGLVSESVANGLPVLHVGINYRLGGMFISQSLLRQSCYC